MARLRGTVKGYSDRTADGNPEDEFARRVFVRRRERRRAFFAKSERADAGKERQRSKRPVGVKVKEKKESVRTVMDAETVSFRAQGARSLERCRDVSNP